MLRPAKALPTDGSRLDLLSHGFVAPVGGRCVQCGVCNYSCPAGIDVRGHARRGIPILAAECMSCGACVARCPRGALEVARALEAA